MPSMRYRTVLPYIVAIAVFLVATFLTFSPQFSGKVLKQDDITNQRASAREINNFERDYGIRPTWTNTSFGGMPTYTISTVVKGNYLFEFKEFLSAYIPRPAGVFFSGMLCAFLLLVLLGVDPWISLAGALAVALSTTTLIVWTAGHTSKVQTIFFLPIVTLGILLAFRQRYLLGALVFGLGMGLAVLSNHPQMLYYYALTLPLYGLAMLAQSVRKGELSRYAKAVAVLVAALVVGLGAGAGTLLTTLDYSKASTRGGQVLEKPLSSSAELDSETPSDSGDGLSWNYAMKWSADFKDLLATYAPLAAGGGKGQRLETDNLRRTLSRVGFNQQSTIIQSYHGGKTEGTDGPEYFGAVLWSLFILGLFTARRPLVIWLGGGTLLILLISQGKNLEWFNSLLYHYVPLFDKFRAPSSALNVAPLLMATLGFLGLQRWLNSRQHAPDRAARQLKLAAVTSAVMGLLILFVCPLFIGFLSSADGDLGAKMSAPLQQAGRSAAEIQRIINTVIDATEDARLTMYRQDAWRSFLFTGLTLGLLLLLLRQKVSVTVAGLCLAGLLAVDQGGINARYLQAEVWQKKQRTTFSLPEATVDRSIKQDTDPHFRVLDLRTNPWSSALASYHHRNIGGYSAVKMRRFQDVITAALGGRPGQAVDPDVLNMLNVRYLIRTDEQAERRAGAYGPAWLAGRVLTVPTNNAELAALTEQDNLQSVAIVHEAFAPSLAGLQPDGQGTIKLTSHGPLEVRYDFDAPTEQLVVFSEIWYGPDKGWTLTVDGQETELIRANYLLRAARVPAGQHELVMRFAPRSYSAGVAISTISSLLLLLGLIGYVFYFGYWKQRNAAAE